MASDLFSPDIHYATRDQNTEMYVYPKEIPGHKITVPFQQMMGEVVSKRFLYEDNFTFRGIRDYAPTDNMGDINWKASAKTGGLKVNLHDYTSSPEVMIVLNLDEPGILFETELLEDCIRYALTFAKAFINENVPTSLLTNGRYKITGETISLEAGASEDHIRNFRRALARIDLSPEKTGTISELVLGELEKNRSDQLTYLYISTSRRDDAINAAKELTDRKGKLMWICPLTRSMEEEGPADARIEFVRMIHE